MTDQAPKPELEQIRDKLGRLATSLETGENFPEGHQLVLMLRHWENTIEVENTKRITIKLNFSNSPKIAKNMRERSNLWAQKHGCL